MAHDWVSKTSRVPRMRQGEKSLAPAGGLVNCRAHTMTLATRANRIACSKGRLCGVSLASHARSFCCVRLASTAIGARGTALRTDRRKDNEFPGDDQVSTESAVPPDDARSSRNPLRLRRSNHRPDQGRLRNVRPSADGVLCCACCSLRLNFSGSTIRRTEDCLALRHPRCKSHWIK